MKQRSYLCSTAVIDRLGLDGDVFVPSMSIERVGEKKSVKTSTSALCSHPSDESLIYLLCDDHVRELTIENNGDITVNYKWKPEDGELFLV